MRIIAGKYRGKVLGTFRGDTIRPTADRVKESVFSILSGRIGGARVLDLFCGSGALGIECLSRGAKEVVFNDLSKESLALTKKNLVRVDEPTSFMNLDFKSCLLRARGPFDLIFSDPPYKEDFLEEILRLLSAGDLLAKGGLLIHESERQETPISGWRFADVRKYGRTIVYFTEKEQTN